MFFGFFRSRALDRMAMYTVWDKQNPVIVMSHKPHLDFFLNFYLFPAQKGALHLPLPALALSTHACCRPIASCSSRCPSSPATRTYPNMWGGSTCAISIAVRTLIRSRTTSMQHWWRSSSMNAYVLLHKACGFGNIDVCGLRPSRSFR